MQHGFQSPFGATVRVSNFPERTSNFGEKLIHFGETTTKNSGGKIMETTYDFVNLT